MTDKKHSGMMMFFIGLGGATKVYLGGVIALTELVVFAVAPMLLFKYYQEYKRNGMLVALWLSLAMIPGCFIACLVNNVPWIFFIKSSMQFYSIFAMIVVFYFVLRKSLYGIGWFYVGFFISTIVSIFILNPQVLMNESSVAWIGQMDVEEQMEGVLFWYPKITQILRLPVQGWYFSMPIVYSVVAPIIAGMIAIFISVSGRGAAAMGLLSSLLILYCRRSRRRIGSLGRNFIFFVLVGICAAIGIKSLYSYAASTGLLGEKAQYKYYMQTHGDSSFLGILIGGRTEFFIAIRAMIDNPIVGIGPAAEDKKGYVREFLIKYGDQEDFDAYIRHLKLWPDKIEVIPQHSTLTQFWGNAGILGLVFCSYFLYLLYMFFRRYAAVIPQWFGYFAIAIPPSIFSLFFNPYTERATLPLLITCLLLSKAVGQGKLRLPYEMEMEAIKYE